MPSARNARRKGSKKTLPIYIDEELERKIEELQNRLGGLSKNDVIRLAIVKLYEIVTKEGM